MIKKMILCSLLVAYAAGGAYAGGKPGLSDTTLSGMFRALSRADGYAYKTEVTTFLEGNPKQQKISRMQNYQSQSRYLIYARSEESMFFSSRYGQLRINFKDKTAYYKQYENDSVGAASQKQMLNAQLSLPLDSIFLKDAVILKKEEDQFKQHYHLQYQTSSPFRDMDVLYIKKQFFQSITYKIVRPPANGSTDGPSVIQQVRMYGYERNEPKEVSSLVTDATDLLSFLKKNYPGFKISAL